MCIEKFLDECAEAGYDAAVFREFNNLWAISVNEHSPSMPGPEPRRRYATGNTWTEALENWRSTNWVDRRVALAVIFGDRTKVSA